MEFPYNVGDHAPTRHLMSPSKTSAPGMDYIFFSHLSRGPIDTLLTSDSIKATNHPFTNSQTLLLKIPPSSIIEHEEIEMVPNLKLHFYD